MRGTAVTNENIVVDTAERIFTDLAHSQDIIRVNSNAWKPALWQALEEAGLTLAWVDETQGGAGVGLDDGFAVLRAAGRAAIAVPLAETMLAGWLLGQGGIAAPAGAMTVAPARPRDRIMLDDAGCLIGVARHVSFASEAQHVVVLVEGADGASIALIARDACTISQGVNLAGELSETVTLTAVVPLKLAQLPDGIDRDALMLMGSAVRAQQMAGALETMLQLSVRYATERVAFEKPIAKFQAVQHNLARLAGETAAAVAAAASAADAISAGSISDAAGMLEITAAKIRCCEAAQAGVAIAHQVHGAIGFTDEHILHRLTLRALAWRDDFGSESYWGVRLGEFVARRGVDELWPLVASR